MSGLVIEFGGVYNLMRFLRFRGGGLGCGTGIGWLGVGVGLAGGWRLALWLVAMGAARRLKEVGGDWFFWVTALTGIVFWAVGMQRQSPFSTGQTLAFGFSDWCRCGSGLPEWFASSR